MNSFICIKGFVLSLLLLSKKKSTPKLDIDKHFKFVLIIFTIAKRQNASVSV